MKMKIAGVAVAGSILLAGAVYAQSPKIADEVVQRLTVELGLSAQQVSEIRPIIVSNIEKRMAMFNSAKDKSALQAQLIQSQQAETQEIDRILTPEQIKKMDLLEEQERNRFSHGAQLLHPGLK